MKRRDHPDALIHKVVYENPLSFWKGCARWQPWPEPAAVPAESREPKATSAGRPSKRVGVG